MNYKNKEYSVNNRLHYLLCNQVKPCISPNGRTDGHMKFASFINGEMVCAFCKRK